MKITDKLLAVISSYQTRPPPSMMLLVLYVNVLSQMQGLSSFLRGKEDFQFQPLQILQ